MLDSAYISRAFPLGPVDAIEATEAWFRQLVFASGERRLVAGHRLLLRPYFAPTDFDPQLLRRLRGTLWVGWWWWPVRVELELARYSRFASEIAVRPLSLRWPVGIERYERDAADAVVEVVAAPTTGVQTRAKPAVRASPPARFELDRMRLCRMRARIYTCRRCL